MVKTTEDKIVFAISPGSGDGVPVVIVGIPVGAWDYMREGKTNHFDLTKVGLKCKFVMFGAATHDAALRALQAGASARGEPMLDERRTDFSIPPHPAIECWELCEKLRAGDGDTVELLCDNPEPSLGGPPNAIECSGLWTDFENRRFEGGTILDVLKLAVAEKEKWNAEKT